MAASRKRSNPLLRAAVAFALSQGALVHQAHAQSTDAKKDEVTAVDQVVVTARRREELIQDVPGAVTAFSGAALEQAGIPDLTGIADLTPNTTFKTSRATNSTLTAFIRGIGQQDPVAGYEQGVGIYLDDIYLARPQGALHRHLRPRAHRGPARTAGHALRSQHHRRRGEVRDAQALGPTRSSTSRRPSATTTSSDLVAQGQPADYRHRAHRREPWARSIATATARTS